MGTSEKPDKRVRFMDSEVTIDFSDETTHHDRVLLVAGQKFHVISSLLSQFSDFFQALFNSNFKEKNEETIELKDITSDDFDNFIRALYPIRFKVAGENLAGIMQLSIRFLCPSVCLEFLKNKGEFNKFSPRELLEWSEGSDSQELKTRIEQDLIEKKFLDCTSLAGFQQEAITILFWSSNYSADKLKDLLEKFIFKDPQRKTHYGLLDLLYYSEKYDLSKVRKILDDFFCGIPFDGPCQVHRALLVRKICRLPIFEVKFFEYMLQLVNNINKDKKFPPLEPANYRAQLYKKLAVDYLRKMYKKIDKTQEVVGNFLQIASQYKVLKLQKDVEANLVNDFINKKGLKYMNLAVQIWSVSF